MSAGPVRCRPLRVVKVGGSLLDWPQLPAALTRWLIGQDGLSVLLAGGGELADTIRRADARYAIGEEQAHWLCIEAMGITAQLLARLLRMDKPVLTDLADLERHWPKNSPLVSRNVAAALSDCCVFDVRQFLREVEPALPGRPLPHGWSATSDSIAARLAHALQADELVLLKSADPPPHSNLADLAAQRYVDAWFPQAAEGFAARYVNLRNG